MEWEIRLPEKPVSCPLTLYFATNVFKKKKVILYWKKNLPFCTYGTKSEKLKSVILAFSTLNNHMSMENAPKSIQYLMFGTKCSLQRECQRQMSWVYLNADILFPGRAWAEC